MQTQSIKQKLRIFLMVMAFSGLALTLVPSILNWQGIIGPGQVNNLMLAGTIIWFVAAGFLFWARKT